MVDVCKSTNLALYKIRQIEKRLSRLEKEVKNISSDTIVTTVNQLQSDVIELQSSLIFDNTEYVVTEDTFEVKNGTIIIE